MPTDDRVGLPPLRGGGLVIPRFGPDTTLSVLLPPAQAAPPAPGQEGRHKPPKQFRAPGGRQSAVVTSVAMQPHTADTAAGRTKMVQFHGRSVPAGGGPAIDGPAELAAELLAQGILRESDWCGSLSQSVRRGLDRWAHEEMGADRHRVLTGLELVYTDDAPAYALGVRLPRWREHFKARPDRPVGFFALWWGVEPRRVRVRAAVLALEAAWPGYGFGLLELLENTFVSSVQGHTFYWGQRALRSNAVLLKKFERHDQDPLGALAAMFGEASGVPRDVTEEDFFRAIPREAVSHGWHPERAARVRDEAPGARPELADLTARAFALWEAVRAAARRFHSTNHAPFLSWEMTQTDLRTGRGEVIAMERLERAPTCYTSWDESDPMGRLVDDYHEHCRRHWLYTDLTWMHCFQVGHAGVEPREARRHLEQKERLVRKLRRDRPEALTFVDPDYQKGPMPDGGLPHAVTALKMAMRTLSALDALLWALDSMEDAETGAQGAETERRQA